MILPLFDCALHNYVRHGIHAGRYYVEEAGFCR